MRRITILATVLIIAVSLGVGIYFLATSGQGTRLDQFIGQPVSASDLTALTSVSGQPYGPAAPISMQNVVQKYGGTPFVSGGKPTVVYVGGEFCPYCAIERWSLIMALTRFGSFTGLHYMTSAPNDVGAGDYATFTFVGSSYTSQYIAFRAYEASDRSERTLQSVPTNYSAVWNSKANGGVPFVDFGNSYLAISSILPDPTILTGKNWTSILSGISTSDSTGIQIREGANLITAVICKLTQGAPVSVCSASPIASQTSSISGSAPARLEVMGSLPSTSVAYTARPSLRRLA